MPSHFSRASIAVNCLDRLHQTKKRGLVPCSLYLTLITSKVKHFMTLCWRISVGKFAFFSSLSLSLAKVFFKAALWCMVVVFLIWKKVWTLQICTFQNVPTNYSFFLSTRFLLLFFFNKYFLSRATNIAVHFLGIAHKWYSSEHQVILGSELQMSWFQKVLTSKSKIGFHLGDFNIILFCSISCTRTVLHILNKALCNTVA